VPAPAAAPAKRASSLEKPFIQIGIFSVEQNASNTATAMRQAGMVPTVIEQNSQGKTFWRVIVGPATSASERGVLLKKIKGIGFDDAYPVTN
jgi:cell division septation protein DedD